MKILKTIGYVIGCAICAVALSLLMAFVMAISEGMISHPRTIIIAAIIAFVILVIEFFKNRDTFP